MRERVEQAPRDTGRDDGIAGGHRANAAQQVGGRHVLEQEAARAGAQGGECVLVEVEGREDENA